MDAAQTWRGHVGARGLQRATAVGAMTTGLVQVFICVFLFRPAGSVSAAPMLFRYNTPLQGAHTTIFGGACAPILYEDPHLTLCACTRTGATMDTWGAMSQLA